MEFEERLGALLNGWAAELDEASDRFWNEGEFDDEESDDE